VITANISFQAGKALLFSRGLFAVELEPFNLFIHHGKNVLEIILSAGYGLVQVNVQDFLNPCASRANSSSRPGFQKSSFGTSIPRGEKSEQFVTTHVMFLLKTVNC
jgi:hypothetical protein